MVWAARTLPLSRTRTLFTTAPATLYTATAPRLAPALPTRITFTRCYQTNMAGPGPLVTLENREKVSRSGMGVGQKTTR